MSQMMQIFSVYDRKAGYYLPMFTCRSEGEALRHFSKLVTESDTPCAQYPADFDLCRLGRVDLETGLLEKVQPIDLLINGLVSFTTALQERERYKKVSAAQLDLEDVLRNNGGSAEAS